MDKKVILPMAKPIITAYPMDANAISIITNNEEAYPWVLNNFIQIMSWRRADIPWKFDLWYSDCFKFYKRCPFLECQRIKKHFVRDKWNDNIHDFIIDSINHGYYVYLVVNTRYISAYEPKQESDIPHDMLIYGYNSLEKIYYIADSMKHGNYSFDSCTYDELENAFHYLKEEHEDYASFSGSIELLSYKKVKAGDFDLSKVIDGLKAYLNSHAFDERSYSNALYGINVYDNYKMYLSLLHDNEVKFDIRPVHNFWEHKFVMMLRLTYMNELGVLHNEGNLLNTFKEIEQKTLVYRNLLLKYAFNHNKEILTNISSELDKIKDNESMVLEQVLRNIKKL
jgi:hypothetical protein